MKASWDFDQAYRRQKDWQSLFNSTWLLASLQFQGKNGRSNRDERVLSCYDHIIQSGLLKCISTWWCYQTDAGAWPILTPADLAYLPLPGNISNTTREQQRALASVSSSIQPCQAKSVVFVCVSVSVPLPTSNYHQEGHQRIVKYLIAKSKSEDRSSDLRSPCKGHLASCHKTAWAEWNRWVLLACVTYFRKKWDVVAYIKRDVRSRSLPRAKGSSVSLSVLPENDCPLSTFLWPPCSSQCSSSKT